MLNIDKSFLSQGRNVWVQCGGLNLLLTEGKEIGNLLGFPEFHFCTTNVHRPFINGSKIFTKKEEEKCRTRER